MLTAQQWLRRSVFALIVVTMSPVTASAQLLEIMEWIERLSGPEFSGVLADIPIACQAQNREITRGDCDPVPAINGNLQPQDRKLVFSVRAGRHQSTPGGFLAKNYLTYADGTSDEDRVIQQWTVGGSVTWQFHKALEAVGAMEVAIFTGRRVDDFSVLVASPGLVVKPLALLTDQRWGRVLKIHARRKFYLQELTAARFGAIAGFESGRESVWALGFGIDFRY